MSGVVIEDFETFTKATRAVVPSQFKSQFNAVWFHEAAGKKPKRNWLIKNLILAGTFGIVYGPPGCGKSFLVSDLMLTCAASCLDLPDLARHWFKFKVKPIGVIYVVAEGSDDFTIRMQAWRTENNIPADAVIPFVYLPTSIDMRSSDEPTMKLAEEVKALSEQMHERCGVRAEIVVIDTVARALAGGNENASDVMGAFVINCGKLHEQTGCAVLGVHHGGKEGGKGPRGHEALHGAADFEIEVAPATAESPNGWTVRKLKAGPAGASHRFRLKQRVVGKDDEGDPITSCVVIDHSDTGATIEEKKKLFRPNDGERAFLEILSDAIKNHGQMVPSGIKTGSNVSLVVDTQHVRDLYWERYSATEAGDTKAVEERLRGRWTRATKSLLKFKVIGSDKPWLWMTGKEIERVTLNGAAPLEPRSKPASQQADPPEPDDLPAEDMTF